MIACIVAATSLARQTLQDPINSALLTAKAAVDVVWSKGYEDGQKKRDIKKALGIAERAIDSYHVSTVSKDKCSWAYLLHPRVIIYAEAHRAGSQYWSQDQIEKAKAEMGQFGDAEPKLLSFLVVLNEMPAFDGPYGRLTRFADPSNLTDVHCVLKVGGRIVQPISQPGDLSISKSDNLSIFTVPTTTYVRGSSTGSASAYGNGGYASATGTSYTSYAVTTYNEGAQPYSTYRGQFVALFPLRDQDGKATIRPEDKELELVVVKKSAELTAKYRLSDWLRALEK